MGECEGGSLFDALTRAAGTGRGLTIAGRLVPDVTLSYADLLQRSLRRLSALRAAGVGRGDAVIILTDDIEAFVAAFWACLAGGMVAVPVSPPNTPSSSQKLLAVAATLGTPWIYTDIDLRERLSSGTDPVGVPAPLGARLLAAGPDCDHTAAEPLRRGGDDVAFVQFSSGSTGASKGVTLTHANVIANVEAIARRFRSAIPEPRLLNWMPLTHDFGMIWFHILPVVCGYDHCLIPTKAFTRQPLTWMRVCAEFGASITAGPNYAYSYFLKHHDPGKDYGWDLSKLRLIANGAEPIVPDLSRRFAAALAPRGLPRSAVTAAYGLAEATLAATLAEVEGELESVCLDRRRLAPGDAAAVVPVDHPDAFEVAVVGRPLDNVEIRVTDDAGVPRPDGVVGRVRLRGPALMRGYYNDTAATRAAIDAEGWLDTGDLGFMRGADFVVTGRRKDIVIVGGVNYYPQDIEAVVAGLPELDLNTVAACAVRSPGAEAESLAVFVLFRRGVEAFAPLAAAVEERVGRVLGIAVDHCLAVPRIPKTTSGKIQRHRLVRDFADGVFAEQAGALTRLAAARDDEMQKAWLGRDAGRLLALLVEVAERFAPGAVDADRPLLENGLTSLLLTRFAARLNQRLGLDLPVTVMFERPLLRDLAEMLIARAPAPRAAAPRAEPDSARDAQPPTGGAGAVAILGMGLRLPGGVRDPDGFWRLLDDGRDAVGPPPPGRWAGGPAPGMATDRAGFLHEIDAFDAPFFRLPAVEAEALDPQQRLLLTAAWEAFEHAAVDPVRLKGRRVGVFVGISGSDYGRTAAADGPYFYTGTAPAVAAGRLAYVFGFTGPCLAVDTACSSALVALHQAVASLRSGESELALVCGVNLLLSPDTQAGLSRMNALSPDGRCKTFDDAADGYARGEGCVALLLKRADAAFADADPALAVLRGSAINQDGASNGLTAPNGAAQAAVMRAALADAGLTPDAVDVLEAHGTGTPLGDPIEVMAAAEVYGPGRAAGRPLLLGAVKTAVGHLEAAAGLVGVAKVVLALGHGRLPPNLHCRELNRHVPWSRLPVAVIGAARPWPERSTPRRAAVSAFGMSGTNAHVILEAAPERDRPATEPGPVIMPVSARSDAALAEATARWADAAASAGVDRFADLARTAATGRAAFPSRRAVVARDADSCALALRRLWPARPREVPRVVFAFAGQGSLDSEAWGALRGRMPAFGASLAASERALGGTLGAPLSDVLFTGEGAEARSGTAAGQPALVALQVAIAAALREWGIAPAAVIGHSLGEVAAAVAAGALGPDEAVRFAAGRGRLMGAMPPGSMALVHVSRDRAEAALEPGVSLAAVNGPGQSTLSGSQAALGRVLDRLRAAGVRSARLPVAHAFHSADVDPLTDRLAALATEAGFGPARVPFHSTLLGRRAEPGEIAEPSYWARQAREPVLFGAALASIAADPRAVVIEVGTGASLAPLAARALPDLPWLTCAGRDPEAALLEIAAELYERGLDLDWARLFRGRPGLRAAAPTYPFQGRVPVLPLAPRPTAVAAPSAPPPTSPKDLPAARRPAEIRAGLVDMLGGLAGREAAEAAGSANWFELGLDSLLLVQLQQAVNRRHGLSLRLADLYRDGDTLDRLVALVDASLPPEPADAAPTAAAPAAAGTAAAATADGAPEDLRALLARQVDAMSALFARQIDLLAGKAEPAAAAPRAPAHGASARMAAAPDTAARLEIKGLYRRIPGRGEETEAQRAHVAALAASFNAGTRGSKRHTEEHRPVFANPRSVIGFRPEWKELIYPLHVARAEGAHVWDVDGRRYVDVTMGFGATLFGHNPPFVRRAIEAELAAGAPLGPQTTRSGTVARLIAKLTGVERVAFFSTGSEAVMVAVRLARAVTGRRRIALFADSYHGTFDGVLAAGWTTPDGFTTMPVTDGTPQGMIDDVLVLRYGESASLELIRRHAGELAAVLVEPVQSRAPAPLPADFLAELRTLTRERDVALIFDEMITGFRIHPGGAQRLLGIQADIVTYGKVVGGGLPIGVVAGSRRFLDAVDGGAWRYGDDSAPTARTAFVAGTFNSHPLTMAAAEAVLLRLDEAGPALQDELGARTAALCRGLDGIFRDAGLPVRTSSFGSLFRYEFAERCEILNYHLLQRGVFVWEGRNCFLSTAHTGEDVAAILDATRSGAAAMVSDGWLGDRREASASADEGSRAPDMLDPEPTIRADVPGRRALSHLQREMVFALAAAPDMAAAYVETVAFTLDGPLDREALTWAVEALVARHEALRAGSVGERDCAVAAPGTGLPEVIAVGDGEAALRSALASTAGRGLDLAGGPLFRATLLVQGPDRAALALSAHHVVADGWSLGLIVVELAELYRAARHGFSPELPSPVSFAAFNAWAAALSPAAEPPSPSPRLALPTSDDPRPAVPGGRLHRRDPRLRDGQPAFATVKALARRLGVTPVAALTAAFAALLGRLADQRRFAIGLPVAGHAAADMPTLVGHASAVVPLAVNLDPGGSFAALAARLHSDLAALGAEPDRPFRPGGTTDPVDALINVDRGFSVAFDGLAAAWLSAPIARSKAGLFLNVLEFGGEALFDFDYDGARFDRADAERWFDDLLAILAAAAVDPHATLAALPPIPAWPADRHAVGAFGAPVPVGVPGELQRLTATGWAPEGLVGRLESDGTVVVLGPTGRQVRIAGAWVDLDGVEAALLGLPGLREAAVVLEDGRITAFTVGVPDAGRLARWARRHLPPGARPTAFAAVDALPRGADGAVDLARLAALSAPRASAPGRVAPRTEDEMRIAAIWREVLRAPDVGVEDDFFDLGGHSLKALAILSRIEERFGRRLPLAAFLARPTIAALATLVAVSAPREPIPRCPEAEHYPASGGQARLWLEQQLDPGLTAYNVAFMLAARRRIGDAALRRALTRLAARHEGLRTALVEVDGEPRQLISPEPALDFDVVDAGTEAGCAAAARALARVPFDLASAPLWRARLLDAGEASAIAVSIHHAISDVWSVEVFVRELLDLLDAEEGGTAAALPPLPVAPRDYAHAQREGRAGRQAVAAAWRDRLADGPPPLDLPSDRPRPAARAHRGAVATAAVPSDAAAALRDLAASASASLFAAVGAGLQILLHRLTGRTDALIGTAAAGRDGADLDGVIGFFVETLPVRLDLSVGATYLEVLRGFRKRLNETLAEALPLDEILEAVAPQRKPGRDPLFDVVLVMDERDGMKRLLAARGFELVEVDAEGSQFDLAIYVTDSAGSLALKAIYDSDLFAADRAARMLDGLVDVLVAAAHAPDAPHEALLSGSRSTVASFHQERLWFVDRFERGVLYPEGPAYYNMPVVLALDGRPDPATIQAGLDGLAAEHGLLRAAFASDGEAVSVVVAPSARIPLAVLPCGGADPLPAALADAARPFDIARAPLVRATLAVPDQGPALLALTAHHAVADRAALASLARALFRRGSGRAAPPCAPSFAAVVAGPERAAAGAHAGDAAFWRAALDGMAPLVLPTDRPRPAVHTFAAGRTALRLDGPRAGRIGEVAAAAGTDRAGVLRAAFQAVLALVSGQEDVVIGETVAPAGPGPFGPRSNLVAERFALSPGEGFIGAVRRSAAGRAEVLAHAGMPFDLAVLAVKPRNDMSRTALFDALFHADAEPAPEGMRVVETGLGFGKYDLVLACHEAPDALQASLAFNLDLFDQGTGERMGRRFERFLDGALADPDLPVGEVDLLLPGEADDAAARAIPRSRAIEGTIHGAFERVAAARPDVVAVVDGASSLSYGALDAAANRLAGRLRAAGVGPEDPVGILMDRGAGVVVAMLGLLKAGAAYVPIDPDYPAARRRFMAEDAGMRLAVTDRDHRADAEALGLAAIDVDGDGPGDAGPGRPATPASLAYVIYTSGSTGTPKGVAVEHRQVTNLLFQEGLPFAFGPSDVWTLFHSPCFDFSVWEIYGALLFGGRVVVVPSAVARDPDAFLALLSAQRVTVLNQTPGAFYALADAALARPATPLALETVIFGGEALQPGRLGPWHAAHPRVRLVNMYGITETTVHVTARDIGAAEIADGRSAIGSPLPGYGLMVVDAALRPRPPGLAGEICVLGGGVARGYLGRPELTAERFVPLAAAGGARAYRSGDLGRLDPDGGLIYLGRLDEQVKVRGFRIETSEIESQLVAHPLVRSAVVLPDGEGGLAAWLVCDPGLTRDAVLSHLGERLPPYMVPARFSRVEAVPMTPHGKVDRRRLASAEAEPLGPVGTPGARPRPGIESALAAIWGELLPGRPVCRDDNFFELGGHSLKAVQAVSRIRQRLGRALTLKDFFSAPTLATLAERLGPLRAVGEEAIPIAPPSADYPLSFAQGRLWALQAREPGAVHYNMVGGFLLEGALAVPALGRAFAALLCRHEVLRTRFALRRGEPRQVIDPPPGGFDLAAEDGAALGDPVSAVFGDELRRAFALDAGPLLRVRLHSLAPGGAGPTWLLTLNLHHIVADGWSVNVMLRDLERLYRAALGDLAPPSELAAALPPLAIQHKDFAVWQRTRDLSASRAHWLGLFEDGAPPLDLPTDRPRPPVPSRSGAIASIDLGLDLSGRLRELALAHDASLFTVLAALVQLQLHLASGAPDITLGTAVAGRRHLDLEPQAGLFLNLLPLRVAHPGGRSFTALVEATRTAVLDALQHGDYPFDLLVEEAGGAPSGGRHPLFDVLLIVQNNEPLRLDLPGVIARPVDDATVSAKYDLNYMVEDRPALELKLEYATDLFDTGTATRIAQEFAALARLVVDAPALTAGEIGRRLGRAAAPDARRRGAPLGAPLPAEEW